MEEITHGEDCRNKLIEGINELNKAVAATMGPMGKTVIIPDDDIKNYGKYKVTKDGVSVSRNIHFKDPIKNIGAELVKQAAEKTVKDAGDGTTTATVLATAFINNLKDFKSKDINEEFDRIIPEVLKQLKLNSRELKREDIAHVATISANNDIQIGNLIQQAYNHSNIVKVEESNNTIDELITHNGMHLEDITYLSKHFITNERKGLVEYDKPFFLLLDCKLDKLNAFEKCFEYIANEKHSIVIMTEHIHDQTLQKLESLVLSKMIDLVVIKTPGFGPFRKDLIKDISDFTGATIISDLSKVYKPDILGTLDSIKVTNSNTLLVKNPDIDIDYKINSLEEYIKTDLDPHNKDLINKRIENLKGKISIIKVGGQSELEMKERKDRIDDAVLAVQCALEEGIVEGGGRALAYISRPNLLRGRPTIEINIWKSLESPQNTITANGQINYWSGSMFDKNIIDPLKVTRCALENAVSVAKVILSTEAVVLNPQQWK